MKISETQLDAKLLKEEPNVFIILGEEPIRIQELTEQIYASLELRGFKSTEFKSLHPGGNLGKDLKNLSEVMHLNKELPLAHIDE